MESQTKNVKKHFQKESKKRSQNGELWWVRKGKGFLYVPFVNAVQM